MHFAGRLSMKIGILTYHNAINYGAVLQTYALRQYLEKITCGEVSVIDYRSPGVEKQYRLPRPGDCGSVKSFVHSAVTVFLLREKKNAFRKFSDSCLNKTAEISALSEEGLRDIDVLVVGSDQVWNPSCTRGDASFLAAGLNSKIARISYAASMGNCGKIAEFQKCYGIDYLRELKKFRAISCREEDAASYLTEKLAVPCETVIDPVLLQEKFAWDCLLEEADDAVKQYTEPYIFVYNLGNYPLLYALTAQIRKKTGYRVIAVSRNFKGELLFRSCDRKSNVGPREFLYLLSHAALVLSDSFHATAFSVLFERPFYTVGDHRADNTNSRLKNILGHYGLESRYVTEVTDDINGEKTVDFSTAENILEKDRRFAEEWICTALGVCRNRSETEKKWN